MPESVNRRAEKRHALPERLGAEIEFDGPDGEHHGLRLTEIGIQGAAFAMPSLIPGIERRATVLDAVIRVALLEIQCQLTVVHVPKSGYTCGVQLYPKRASDRNQLVSLISSLQSARKD